MASPSHDAPSEVLAQADVRLADLGVGHVGELVSMELDGSSSELLSAMGLRVGCRLTVCRCGGPCVVRVCDGHGGGCRVGMSRAMALGLRVNTAANGSTDAGA